MNASRTGGWRVALPFLLPNFVGFVIFLLGPLVGSLLLSFCSWDLLTPPVWIGAGNFRDIVGFHHSAGGWSANDPAFWHYLGNTLVLLLNLPASMAGSLALALMLRRRTSGVRFYRLVFYLPSIVSGVAIFYLWRWMFNPDEGLINALLAAVGLHGPAWLSDPMWAKPAILLMTFWISVGGGGMILYLAALQGVPRELEDAAAIDGAGRWDSFRAVIWPAIRPVTFFIVTTGLIYGLQSGGEIAYVMTGGGPAGSTTTLGFYVFQKAYQQFEVGYGAAVAWIIFILVFGFTMLQWRRGAGAEIS